MLSSSSSSSSAELLDAGGGFLVPPGPLGMPVELDGGASGLVVRLYRPEAGSWPASSKESSGVVSASAAREESTTSPALSAPGSEGCSVVPAGGGAGHLIYDKNIP